MAPIPDRFREALATPYPLGTGARERFANDGYIQLRGVLDPPLLSYFAGIIADLTADLNPNKNVPLEARDTYGRAFIQVVNLWTRSELVRELVFSPRLARLAAELLGVDGVRLYHDQALFKEAGGGITPWHADQYYWPMASDRCVTAWIPLQSTPLAMGPLAFASGSHRYLEGRDLPIGDESERRLAAALDAQSYPLSQHPYALGDVGFHLGWTYHRAGANTTEEPRGVITIIYMDAAMRLAEPTNANQKADRDAFTPDAEIGDIMNGPLTPVLWRS